MSILLDHGGRYTIAARDPKKIKTMKDTLYLFEWVEYQIIAKKDVRNVVVYVGDEKTEEVYKTDDEEIRVPFVIGNYIGKTKLRIFENGREIMLKFKNVQILSEKISKIYGIKLDSLDINNMIKLHNEFCKNLIDEITKRCVSLPFSIHSPTGFEFTETEEPVNELFAYHFLRSNKDIIISAYENILRYPHRKLTESLEFVDFWKATGADEDTVLGMIYYSDYLVEVPSKLAVIVVDGKGYAPTKILQKNKYETLDTSENRFAKYFLAKLINWCERVLKTLDGKIDEESREKICELYATLEYFWNDPIFSKVGELTMFPYTSQVLLRREGYRDLLELWKEFKAYLPFFSELEKAIANKDIAKLYEYWCFFKLAEELGKILGRMELKIVVEPTGELSEGNVYAVFENGWKLYYNRKLKGYSVSLRPDFSLFYRNGLVGVFDAKFKLDVIDINKFVEGDKEMVYKPDIQTWAKLEDIYKMHTYKDTLKAKFAVVLYPGNKSTFFKVNGEKIEKFKFDDLFDDETEGIGYMSYKPNLEGTI